MLPWLCDFEAFSRRPGSILRARIAHARAPRLACKESCKQSCSRAPRSGIESIRAAVTAVAPLLSETITLACCVTLPTMALPPSPTDTFSARVGLGACRSGRVAPSSTIGTIASQLSYGCRGHISDCRIAMRGFCRCQCGRCAHPSRRTTGSCCAGPQEVSDRLDCCGD
jgi:hypothetical protein